MKTALITGGAQRIGAQIVQTLHDNGFNIIDIHGERPLKNHAIILPTSLDKLSMLMVVEH